MIASERSGEQGRGRRWVGSPGEGFDYCDESGPYIEFLLEEFHPVEKTVDKLCAFCENLKMLYTRNFTITSFFTCGPGPAGAMISAVHESAGLASVSEGEAPPGFFNRVGSWFGGRKEGWFAPLDRKARRRRRTFLRKRVRKGAASRGRPSPGGGKVSCHDAGESWSACLPKDKWAVPGLPQGRAGFHAGRNGGNPAAGPSPTGRATLRWGSPGGDFRAGGNLGEAGQPKLP
jgi:hypothetical protein